MSEPDWPEREADMALIRRVHELMRMAGEATSQEVSSRARVEAEGLMPAYAEATRRHNCAASGDGRSYDGQRAGGALTARRQPCDYDAV